MPTVAVLNMAGKEVEKIELAEGVFGIEPNVSVMNDMVKAYLANQRQGTQSALTRSEVSGGGRNHGSRRVQAVQDRAPPELRSGHTAASCSHRSREITPSPSTRR